MIRDELARVVAERSIDLLGGWLGPDSVKQDVLAVLYAGRNLLLEGPVGSGKTLLASAVAGALPAIRLAGCDFGCLPGELGCPQCRCGRGGCCAPIAAAASSTRSTVSPSGYRTCCWSCSKRAR